LRLRLRLRDVALRRQRCVLDEARCGVVWRGGAVLSCAVSWCCVALWLEQDTFLCAARGVSLIHVC